MSDQEDRASSTQPDAAQQPTRRQFLARAFTAAAVLVVPAAITGSAPSVAQAQDKDPSKYPEPTRTSDLPPASPSASRTPPALSPSTSRIYNVPSPSSSPAAPATSRTRSIKDKAAQPVVDDTSKSFDSL